MMHKLFEKQSLRLPETLSFNVVFSRIYAFTYINKAIYITFNFAIIDAMCILFTLPISHWIFPFLGTRSDLAIGSKRKLIITMKTIPDCVRTRYTILLNGWFPRNITY